MYSLWLLYLDIEAYTFFVFFLVTEALLFCGVVVVAKLYKNAASAALQIGFKSRDCLPESVIVRAGNLLIGFPSESLVFCPKMSECAIRSKK